MCTISVTIFKPFENSLFEYNKTQNEESINTLEKDIFLSLQEGTQDTKISDWLHYYKDVYLKPCDYSFRSS